MRATPKVVPPPPNPHVGTNPATKLLYLLNDHLVDRQDTLPVRLSSRFAYCT
jgi:hypothetical protein